MLIGPDARREGVAFQLDLDPAEARVQGRGIQIEQVVLNLARNAIEAMQTTVADERRLLISTCVQKGWVIVRVEDTGPGVDTELVDTLFAPFVTSKPDGMGLGLSISRGIIETHGGTLSVSSSSKEGSVFQFSLPLHPRREG
ncbi:sensor histidine kinase [Thiohalomonas denitrificans]|uniref:sensor histidine kinase n=1 Tax=Thiohalomonas denitrificans TaxID=415747 RepID=UPI0037DC3CCB